jgi:hydroxypyruvate reductase
MIASGPAVPDTSTCEQAIAIAEKYQLKLTEEARALLAQETPKELTNVTTQITGSVRELCTAAANASRELGYEPIVLTAQLCCQAREAGASLAAIAASHANSDRKLAYVVGGETVVTLTGDGMGGRNQELVLSAAEGLEGIPNAAVISIGSDGTDGPTDAAGGYADGTTAAALRTAGISIPSVLRRNDAYHALKEIGGLVFTGPTGTNVNDVAILLIRPASERMEEQ